MTNKLISLVLLIFFLATNYSYAEDKFLFPEKKPSVFKKNLKSESLKNLPQKKPIIQTDTKKTNTVKVEPAEKKEVKITKKISVFLLPKKNLLHIKFNRRLLKNLQFLNKKILKKQKKQLNLLKLENGIVL